MIISMLILSSCIPAMVICVLRIKKENSIFRYLATVALLFVPQIIYYIHKAIQANGNDVGTLAIIIYFVLPYYLFMAGVTAFAGCVVIAKRKENNTKNEKVEECDTQ